MGLIAELKRRNVFKVAVAYLLLAWLVMQLGDVLAPALRLPDWVPSLLAFFLILGFPLALFFSWTFELTADGVRLDKDVAKDSSREMQTGRLLNFAIVGLLIVAAAYFFRASLVADREPNASSNAMSDERPIAAEPAISSTSIAVLPFANISQDPNRDYFSDGITEEIINSLVNIPDLAVPARTTVFAFKGQQGNIREIGRSLGVSYILEGTVRSIGDDAIITATLIQVSDGSRLWSERFERRLDNVFALQEELASAIAAELRVELGGIEAVPNRTNNVSAYDNYLRGRAALRKRESKALSYLEQATESDPSFAPAWASLAMVYQTYPGKADQAVVAAERALAIDQENVDALTVLASVYRQSRDWARSDSYFQRALSIDPGSAELLEDYAEFLNLVGRSKQALEVSTRAMEIDPRIQPLVAAHVEALFANKETLKAREVAEEPLELHGDNSGLWSVLLPLWLSPVNGNIAPLPTTYVASETVDFIQEVLQSPRSDSVEFLKRVITHGSEDYAANMSRRRTARLLLLYLGEVDFVINQDISGHSAFPSSMREWLWTPFFRTYRQHPRFPEFLAVVGLIEYWEISSFPEWCRRSPTNEIICQ